MKKNLTSLLTNLLMAGSLLAASAPPTYINEFIVPLVAKPPVIDGTFHEDEWKGAVGFDGFSLATGPRTGKLEERSGRSYIAATEDAFYVALVTELPQGGGKLVAEVKKDILKVIFDDSWEVSIDPDPASNRSTLFQAMFNSIGHGVYISHPRGGAEEIPNWNGGYEIKEGFTGDRWVTEIRIPVKNIDPARTTTAGVWGFAVCRNFKQPWSQASAPGNFTGSSTRFTFVKGPAPVVQVQQIKDPFTRDIETKLSVFNPFDTAIPVKARLDLERNTMFVLKKAADLNVAPSATESLTFSHHETNSTGFNQFAEVTSPDGKAIYYKRKTSWAEPRAKRWDTIVVEKLPVDFRFGYYPYRNKLRIDADISGLPKEAELSELKLTVSKQGSSETVGMANASKFDEDGRTEITIELPDLQDGTYEIAATAVGKNVPDQPLVKTFLRKHYEWEKNPMGRSTKVYPPFTPIEVQGNIVKTVLRNHEVNDLGLLKQVNAGGKDILAGPMSLIATVDGKEVPVTAQPLQFVSVLGNEAVTQSALEAGAFKASSKAIWDYDGTVKYKLTLDSTGGQSLDALTLEIPLKDSEAPYIHAMSDGLRQGPITESLAPGEGIIWDARKLIAGELPVGFCSYIFLGSGIRGLSWFAENDKNWSWDRETPNLEVVRKNGVLTLRIHLVNKPVVISKPRTITFGFLAAPVKPRLKNPQTFWEDNKLALLGTCINWLAGPGDCGSVYPAGRDMYFWQKLAGANQKTPSPAEIKEVAERGVKYFEPFGVDAVRFWTDHVKANLGGRNLGKGMILYYNRATTSIDEEYATFLDEWVLKEMPGHDFKPARPELKLVPSESYIDFALYWYKKSFAEGRNTGIYWDNWFFAPSYNLEMTDAYRDADGEIVPAAGLWGLRELSKRSFVMMNELGMEPRTFAHMTSTSILPMLSFATMQLDWEWKVGEGDYQDRYSREYLQVATSGELAGVVSVPLWDQRYKQDDITGIRSFAGVALVHGATPINMFEKPSDHPEWEKSFLGELRNHLRKPGVRTVHYWDDEKQPVTTADPELPLIVYSLPGEETWVVLCGYAPEDRMAKITIDAKALGLPAGYSVSNVETKEIYPTNNNTIELKVPKHAVIGLKISSNPR